MKRLNLLILIFCLAISLPLGYVVRQLFLGLAQEERAQFRLVRRQIAQRPTHPAASRSLRSSPSSRSKSPASNRASSRPASIRKPARSCAGRASAAARRPAASSSSAGTSGWTR